MKTNLALLLVMFIMSSNTTAETGAKLRVSSFLHPQPTDPALVDVEVTSQGLELSELSDGRWSYKPKDDSKLMGDIKLKFTETPQGYTSLPMHISAPSTTQPVIVVNLSGVKIEDHTRADIEEIYATNPSKLLDEQLSRFYQRTHHLATARISSIRQSPRSLFRKDVRLIFKALESAREIGWRMNTRPSKESLEIAEFLRVRLALPKDAQTIANVLPGRTADAELVATQVEMIEAEHFRKVWEALTREHPERRLNKESCRIYTAFHNSLWDTDPFLRSRLETKDGHYLLVLAQEVVTKCLTVTAESAKRMGNALEGEAKAEVRDAYAPIPTDDWSPRKDGNLERAMKRHQTVYDRLVF